MVDRSGLRGRVIALLGAVALCGCRPESEGERDRGDISVKWGPAPDVETANLAMSLKQSRVLENAAADLNASLKLPRDLPVLVVTCPEPNAYFNAETGQISLCYELLNDIAALAVEAGGTKREAAERLVATWLFVFYHELGHALIALYDLPVPVRHEDAVDDFSAVLLIQAGRADYAVRAAEYWVAGGDTSLDRSELADAHSLDLQRFDNVLCVVYGSDPHLFVPLVTRGFVKEERRKSCPVEYRESVDAWDELLEPWAM